MKAVLYYRGALNVCNYSCPYCAFGKLKPEQGQLAKDERQLDAFVNWAIDQRERHELSIVFIPHGEALIHRYYQEAMVALSHLAHVQKVCVQTNLSARVDWTTQLNKQTAAFWATYHPGQTSMEKFSANCRHLYEQRLRLSVGAVGVKNAFAAIAGLRAALPPDLYMWINAYKDRPNYYNEADLAFLRSIDPHFDHNLHGTASAGMPCLTGENVFFVQGSGKVKRCYQDQRIIGHLYRDGLEGISQKRPCARRDCGCYIGYIHMPHMQLDKLYGDGLLERIAPSLVEEDALCMKKPTPFG